MRYNYLISITMSPHKRDRIYKYIYSSFTFTKGRHSIEIRIYTYEKGKQVTIEEIKQCEQNLSGFRAWKRQKQFVSYFEKVFFYKNQRRCSSKRSRMNCFLTIIRVHACCTSSRKSWCTLTRIIIVLLVK